jgi:hypothetical protein
MVVARLLVRLVAKGAWWLIVLLVRLLHCVCARCPQILDNFAAADIYVERFLPQSSQK